jgi:hypothetical protein
MSSLEDRIHELPKDEKVIVVCTTGERSKRVVSYLQYHGYSNYINMKKGIEKWVQKGFPTKGDTSYIVKYLFKKVYNSFGEPLIQTDDKNGVVYEKYVYKAINAWGASFKANEFYGKLEPGDPLSTTGPASVIDNGFVKLEARIEQIRSTISDNVFEEKYSGEVEDNIIETTLNNGAVPITKKVVPLAEAEPVLSGDVKSEIEALEAKKKSKGLSPSEMATLSKLQILNVLNKKEQDSKNCNG